jgi:hypothetical protein
MVGAKITREILDAPALSKYRHKELYNKPDMTDDEWKTISVCVPIQFTTLWEPARWVRTIWLW